MVDYTTITSIITAFVVPALAGTKFYLTLRSKKAAIQADVHAIRIAVDAVDDAVQAGTLPSESAAKQIWEDILNVKNTVKAATAPPPTPAPAPTIPPAA
jgi:hypothetical protein